MKKIQAGFAAVALCMMITACENNSGKETIAKESSVLQSSIETEESISEIAEIQSDIETFAVQQEELNENKILLSYDEKGDYGQYDLFDGEEYLRYYIPTGNYTVKCKVSGGFYIETIELHKEDGWDTATTIEQIMMSAGEQKDIVIEDGQCISLIINTEIELLERQSNESSEDAERHTNTNSYQSDAYKKGKELEENLSEKLESIDWDENYEKARDVGKDAAEWLNGLFK